MEYVTEPTYPKLLQMGSTSSRVLINIMYVFVGLFEKNLECILGKLIGDSSMSFIHISNLCIYLYATDRDRIPVEIWRIPDTDWTYNDLWRAPLNFEEAKKS